MSGPVSQRLAQKPRKVENTLSTNAPVERYGDRLLLWLRGSRVWRVARRLGPVLRASFNIAARQESTPLRVTAVDSRGRSFFRSECNALLTL